MWEHEQMLKHDAKLDMTFASFYEIYVEDKKERIRDNTWGTKNNIARTKILPYFLTFPTLPYNHSFFYI